MPIELKILFFTFAILLAGAIGFAFGFFKRSRERAKLRRINARLRSDIEKTRGALDEEIRWRLAAEKLGAQAIKPNPETRRNVVPLSIVRREKAAPAASKER